MPSISEMLKTHPGDLVADRDVLVACIEACFECAEVCTSCADACLAEDRGSQPALLHSHRLRLR